MGLIYPKHRVPYPDFFILNSSRVHCRSAAAVGYQLTLVELGGEKHSLFTPRSSHFSREPWFLLLERGIRNQDWGARCTGCQCLSFLVDRLRWQIKEIHMCILTHVYTHMYKYFHMDLY